MFAVSPLSFVFGTSPSNSKTLFTIDDQISVSSSIQSSQSTLGDSVRSIFLAVPFLSSRMAPSVAFCHGEYGSVCLTWQPACCVLCLNSPIVCTFDPSMIILFVTEFRQPIQVQIHLEMPGILVQLGRIQRT